jgi:hypothetical protein
VHHALEPIAHRYRVGCPTFATRFIVVQVGRSVTVSDSALYAISKSALAGEDWRRWDHVLVW